MSGAFYILGTEREEKSEAPQGGPQAPGPRVARAILRRSRKALRGITRGLPMHQERAWMARMAVSTSSSVVV